MKNNDTNRDWPKEVHALQHEVLPSILTDMIKIEYMLEVAIFHDGALGAWQQLPSIFFPLIVARAPEGQIDNGIAGLQQSQMAMQE